MRACFRRTGSLLQNARFTALLWGGLFQDHHHYKKLTLELSSTGLFALQILSQGPFLFGARSLCLPNYLFVGHTLPSHSRQESSSCSRALELPKLGRRNWAQILRDSSSPMVYGQRVVKRPAQTASSTSGGGHSDCQASGGAAGFAS